MCLLRHARAKCFVKLHDFLILGNTKTSAGKVSHFQDWLKRFICSASNSGVCYWSMPYEFPSGREHIQAIGGKRKWQRKGLCRYLLCSWGKRNRGGFSRRQSSACRDTIRYFPHLHRNEEIHKAFLKGFICGPASLSALFHLTNPCPLPALGKHCISGCEALVCI